MRKLWENYRMIVMDNCLDSERVSIHSVEYWQNRLFADTMIIILPLSMITMIIGISISIVDGLPLLAIMNVLSFALVVYIALGRKQSLRSRKFLLVSVTYFAAIYYLIYMGFRSPGYLFLYAACVFGILILPVKYAYLWSWLNIAFCVVFAGVIYFNLSPVAEVNALTIDNVLIITLSVLYLSFITSALLPNLFIGLSRSFERQKELQKRLKAGQEELEAALLNLEQKNDDLENFAYVASHDLQEPLRMVKSFMGQLDRKYSDTLDEKARKYIYFAIDGATRMSNMINALLQFSRVGKQTGEPEKVDLNAVVDELLALNGELIEETKAKIIYRDLPTVTSHKIMLEQVLQNLISNAIKYKKDDVNTKIQIEARELNGEWEVSISDNGIGIAPENEEKVFTIFQRLHSQSEISGTGIGLAIVKKNVEHMGGRIWLRSKIGEGSTFTFTLPKN